MATVVPCVINDCNGWWAVGLVFDTFRPTEASMARVSTRRSLCTKCVMTPLLDVRRSTRVLGSIAVRRHTSSSSVPSYTIAVGRNRVMPMFVPSSHLKICAVHSDSISLATAPTWSMPSDSPVAALLVHRPCGIWLSVDAFTTVSESSAHTTSPLHHPVTRFAASSRRFARSASVPDSSSSSPSSTKLSESR